MTVHSKPGNSEASRKTRAQITKRSPAGTKPGLVVWIWRLEGLKGKKVIMAPQTYELTGGTTTTFYHKAQLRPLVAKAKGEPQKEKELLCYKRLKSRSLGPGSQGLSPGAAPAGDVALTN